MPSTVVLRPLTVLCSVLTLFCRLRIASNNVGFPGPVVLPWPLAGPLVKAKADVATMTTNSVVRYMSALLRKWRRCIHLCDADRTTPTSRARQRCSIRMGEGPQTLTPASYVDPQTPLRALPELDPPSSGHRIATARAVG